MISKREMKIADALAVQLNQNYTKGELIDWILKMEGLTKKSKEGKRLFNQLNRYTKVEVIDSTIGALEHHHGYGNMEDMLLEMTGEYEAPPGSP